MKKIICILISVLTIGAISFAQSTTINSSQSNIQQGVIAKYSSSGVIHITFNKTDMTASSKKALADGTFIVVKDITLTDIECLAINAPPGSTIPEGKYKIVNLTRGSGDPLKGLNVSATKKKPIKK